MNTAGGTGACATLGTSSGTAPPGRGGGGQPPAAAESEEAVSRGKADFREVAEATSTLLEGEVVKGVLFDRAEADTFLAGLMMSRSVPMELREEVFPGKTVSSYRRARDSMVAAGLVPGPKGKE